MKKDFLQTVRFYGILDTGYVSSGGWETKCRALLEGGAGIVQLRAKKESPAQRRNLLERILPMFEGGTVPLVVNDDLELAADFPGVGLHVGQDDACPRVTRERLGPGAVLGLSSVHVHVNYVCTVISVKAAAQRRSLGGPLVCNKNTKKTEPARENMFRSFLRVQKHAQRGGIPRNTMWQ